MADDVPTVHPVAAEPPPAVLRVYQLVGLAGLMMVDVVRNMGTWDSPSPVTSPIMDQILNLIG